MTTPRKDRVKQEAILTAATTPARALATSRPHCPAVACIRSLPLYLRTSRSTGAAISMSEARQILVTSALPYANGSIHLGHMLEYIQTDMWVRFQKLRGNQCIYVCADDAHGSAIMLRAEKEGITPEQLIA